VAVALSVVQATHNARAPIGEKIDQERISGMVQPMLSGRMSVDRRLKEIVAVLVSDETPAHR
jgi:hypothetical protein